MAASKRTEVEVPLCGAHRQRRMVLLGIGVGLLVFGAILFAVDVAMKGGGALAFLGALLFLAGMVTAVLGQSLLAARRMDDHFVWLRGVHHSLVNGLPAWPGPMPALEQRGAAGPAPAAVSAVPVIRPTGMAQAALVSGVLSVFLCPAPVAIVLGILGIRDVKRAPGRIGLGRSIFGLAAGLVGSLVLGAVGVGLVLDEARRARSSASAPRPTTRAPFPTPSARPVGIVILGKDGRMRITAPHGWRAEKDLNPNADLTACDPPQQVCVMVFEDDKAVTGPITLARFSRVARGQVLKNLRASSEGPEASLRVGGHPALQYELRGGADRFELVYLHTSVETPRRFYQVMGWTSSAFYPREKAVLASIAASFEPGS
jgi:hypothetical protein